MKKNKKPKKKKDQSLQLYCNFCEQITKHKSFGTAIKAGKVGAGVYRVQCTVCDTPRAEISKSGAMPRSKEPKDLKRGRVVYTENNRFNLD